jgi:D-alanyl-D-alanine carboxypeptidase
VVGGGSQEDSAADTTTAAGGAEQASEADLDAALEKSFKQSGAPGVIAAVQTPDYTWVRALGVADRTSKEPMKPEVHHRIASVTKTFTGTLLLQAEAEGLLSLEDTIDQYVEGVPNGNKITLRQMADMTSGIADYNEAKQFLDELASNPKRVWTPQELVQIGIKDSPLFDPGTDFHYSNTNTVLLGLVLEQVTGEPLGELYRKWIFERLGLQETSFPNADPSIPDPHAHGYTFFGQSGAEPADGTYWNPSIGWSAGRIISTVEDLLVYGRALGTGEGLLSPEQQAKRLDSLSPDPTKPGATYGIGLEGDRGWLGHAGGLPGGFNTTLYYHPELDAVVVVEVNSSIPSGDCPPEVQTMPHSPKGIPCQGPADPINQALTEALGKPFPPPS